MRRTADLQGGGTPIPRMDLDSPCVPVGWQVALFGRLGLRGRCLGLDRGRPGPQVDMIHWWAGRWPLDRPSRKWTDTQVFKVACLSGLYLVVSGVLASWPLLCSLTVW